MRTAILALVLLGALSEKLTRLVEGGRDFASGQITVSGAGWNSPFEVEGREPLPRRERMTWVNAVAPGFFATLGTRLRAGRDFDAHDRAGAPLVAGRPVALPVELIFSVLLTRTVDCSAVWRGFMWR